MKKKFGSHIWESMLPFLISVLIAGVLSLVFGGGMELFSSVLTVIGILLLCFGVFSGWGHAMIGKFTPNICAMELQHSDPSMGGMVDAGWLIAGAADLLLAFAVLWL